MARRLNKRQALAAVMTGAVVLAGSAQAYDAGEWLLRAGAKIVDPKSDNNDVVSVDQGTQFTFDVSYFVTPRFAVELLAAAPFSHDITLATDGTTVASTDHLPPTLSVQYHFNPNGRVQPYVGAGVNMTLFFNEDTQGPLAGSDLSLDTSFGPAASVGVDVSVTDRFFINADVRWADIDTDAELDGASLGTVEIDPFVFGLSGGLRFGKR